MTEPAKTTAVDDARKSVHVNRLIAIRDWKEPWYSTGVHVPADEMASIASELLVARSQLAEQRTTIERLERELKAVLPSDDDPLIFRMVDSATFDPERQKAKAGGTIGDWMRRAKLAEARIAQLERERVPLDRAGTGNNHNEFASDCFCDKCKLSLLLAQPAEQRTTIERLEQACKANADMYTERLDQTITLGAKIAQLEQDRLKLEGELRQERLTAQVTQLQATVGQLREALEDTVCDQDTCEKCAGARAALATCPAPAEPVNPNERAR